MNKVIEIDGKEVGFKASALTPRLYRAWIGRDMIVDMNRLKKAYDKVSKAKESEEGSEESFSIVDLTIFENAAYVMARHYDPEIPESPDEWLDGFSMFSIYEILPQIMQLWQLNQQTTSVPKKK